MPLRNQEGTPVDPVPFLVVAATAFATCYSFGPLYFVALGTDLATGVLTSTGVFLAATGGAYHQLVWTARPDVRAAVDPARRLWRLVLGAAVGIAVVVLLALPLVVRT